VSAYSVAHTRSALPLLQGGQVRLNRVLWLLVAFLAVYHVIEVAQFVRADRFADFAHYYVYARNLVEGHGFSDNESARQLAQQIRDTQYGQYPAVYPPPFYFLLSPFALLPYRASSILWLFFNECLLLAALVWRGVGKVYHNPVRMATLGVIVLTFQPLYETLALGQANLLLLAGMTLIVRLWAIGSSWCGVVLGLMVMVKPQFALFGVLWVRPTEWRHLGATVVTISGLELGSLAAVGLDDWLVHLRYMRDLPCEISLWAINISLRGFLYRLQGSCQADGFGDPMAVFSAIIGAAVLGALTLHFWTTPPHGLSARFHAAGLVLCAVFLVSPYTQEHHLTVLLIAFAGLALDANRPPEGMPRWGWVSAYALLASAYSLVQFPAVHLGPPSVLLFGKGLGVILLGVVLATSPHPGRPSGRALLPLLLAVVGLARAAHAVFKWGVVGELDLTGQVEIGLASVLLLLWAVFLRSRLVSVSA
jgi:hypothetical protein